MAYFDRSRKSIRCPEHGTVITPQALGGTDTFFCPLCKEKYPDLELMWYHEPMEPLGRPICCETEDIDGEWILVNLTEWIGNGKWLAYDENGRDCVVDSRSLRNPHM